MSLTTTHTSPGEAAASIVPAPVSIVAFAPVAGSIRRRNASGHEPAPQIGVYGTAHTLAEEGEQRDRDRESIRPRINEQDLEIALAVIDAGIT